jgi:oligopeptide/dipeptide ABC transporter ATP-binding protein
MDRMGDLLAVQNITQVFGSRKPTFAVDDVSFRMPETASIVNLVGESGSGKSTIARIILGLSKPKSGDIYYKGTSIFTRKADWQRQFRRETQAVFQDPYSAYNPFYKIERVLKVSIRKFKLVDNPSEAKARIEESLRAVDLRPEEILGKYPHQLSGGQRQRVMLARIHLIRPRLIIADEPVSMVDAGMRATVLNILMEFQDRYSISSLFITHDLSTARYLGGEIIILYQGRIVERGETIRVTSKPLHPYAQLLISSIPLPDPNKRWRETLQFAPEVKSSQSQNRVRCLYAERCPHVMEVCWKVRPPLQTYPGQETSWQVACHLYGDNP